jgi:hypothetical protein
MACSLTPIRRIGFGFKSGSPRNFLDICDVIQHKQNVFATPEIKGQPLRQALRRQGGLADA